MPTAKLSFTLKFKPRLQVQPKHKERGHSCQRHGLTRARWALSDKTNLRHSQISQTMSKSQRDKVAWEHVGLPCSILDLRADFRHAPARLRDVANTCGLARG